MKFSIKPHHLILAAILLIAAFLRVYKLDTVPPGLWPDEALNGTQAIEEPFKIFYTENNGREGLIMALDAISFKVLGVSMFAFRLVPAIIGILTVWGVYLLGSELFKKKNVGLLAALFTATSFWHINFSRINFRAIMLPLILCFSFYFLFLGWRNKKIWPFIVSGIVFGIGFYTYTSFRLAPAILFPALFIAWLASRRNGTQKQSLGRSLIMLFATFFTALPIGLYFLMGHPDQFFTRMGGISVFSQPNPAFAFLESLFRHLAMFNIYGDPNMRHNYSGDPELFLPVGLLFLIGFGQVIKRTFSALAKKDWEGILVPATLFIWFFVMLMPGALTYEGMPHALRVIGVLPVCYIMAALGGDMVYGWAKPRMNKKILAVTVTVFLIASVMFPPYRYFFQWAANPETRNAFSNNLVVMGEFLQNTPDNYQKYVVVYGGDLPMQTVKFIALQNPQNRAIKYIYPDQLKSIENKGPTLVMFMANSQSDLNDLEQKHPGGILTADGQDAAWVYYFNQKNEE
jgi:4-amino-4-deoxy-L-arabinose transferase-like glycosyltransferase